MIQSLKCLDSVLTELVNNGVKDVKLDIMLDIEDIEVFLVGREYVNTVEFNNRSYNETGRIINKSADGSYSVYVGLDINESITDKNTKESKDPLDIPEGLNELLDIVFKPFIDMMDELDERTCDKCTCKKDSAFSQSELETFTSDIETHRLKKFKTTEARVKDYENFVATNTPKSFNSIVEHQILIETISENHPDKKEYIKGKVHETISKLQGVHIVIN